MLGPPRGNCGGVLYGHAVGTGGAGFEDHYITCSRCADIVENADVYVRSMQQASRELRRTTPRVKAANQH